uniref:Protein kinase domain-containing protein n=1 Tax=Rhabditophanes sp. KR3021 TaxID=114890 RepID=A0AC35TGF1_9BILA
MNKGHINSRRINEFDASGRIGEGTYGVVFKARWAKMNCDVALKKIKIDKDLEGVPSTCLREVSLLKELSHPNVVKLYDAIYLETRLFLVFEFIDNDLKNVIKKIKNRKIPLPYIKSFAHQLLNALAYCHARRVLHRDLKPQNLLVTNSGTIKLADFGLARSISLPARNYTHEVVTLWYRAPEIILGADFYSTGVDVWSLSLILLECYTGQALLPGDSEIDQLYKIFKMFGTPNNSIWPGVERYRDYSVTFPQWTRIKLSDKVENLPTDFEEFLEAMLVYNPRERMFVSAGLRHYFLRAMDKDLEPISLLFE